MSILTKDTVSSMSAARQLGARAAAYLDAGTPQEAYAQIAPLFNQPIPFRLLDKLGGALGKAQPATLYPFLQHLADGASMSSWVVCGAALAQQLDQDLSGAFALCRSFISQADCWYATDSLGERLPGPALLQAFDAALGELLTWRSDPNRWVRRACGVAIHFWAKRWRGAAESQAQTIRLLDFLEALLAEHEMDAVKGVGWGLKTLGRYYPDVCAGWLERQLQETKRRPRALTLHKAVTYLPAESKARLLELGETGRWRR